MKAFLDRRAVLIISLVSMGMLAAAYGFEHLGDLPPCKLCWWQRYVFMAAIAAGALTLFLERGAGRIAAGWGLIVLSLVFVAGTAIAGYHVGVEQGLWRGPEGCVAGTMGGDMDAMFDQIMGTALVRCDEVPWSLFGVSMAGYNVVISLGLAGFSGWAAFRRMKAA